MRILLTAASIVFCATAFAASTTNTQQESIVMPTTPQPTAQQNKSAGEAFLAENAKKPGVKTTADGLQYKIIHEGSGTPPTATDTVTVNYEGTLIDGTVFDSSYKRGQPATFPVNGVIKGWTEALQLMKPGATWMLYIPAKLAYGKQGAGSKIGPDETLIFKVDLLSVSKS